jgi:sulfate permease, SulP family
MQQTGTTLTLTSSPPGNSDLLRDLRGGLTAGLLTLVTTIAYAAMAGAAIGADSVSSAVLSGLLGAAIGGGVAALVSPLGVQIHSPRATVALAIAAAAIAIDGQLAAHAPLQTLAWLSVCVVLAAVCQAAFGALRLGGVIRLMPRSVMSGFAIGIALQMAWSQRSSLWPGAAWQFDAATAAALCAALATLLLVVWMQRQRVHEALRGWSVALGFVVGVALCAAIQWAAATPVAALSAMDPHARPLVSLLRTFDVAGLADAPKVLPWVLGYALVIAVVNSLETLTCGLALEARLGRRFDADQALMASALGSLASACVGGLPATGSAAASVANVDAGGRTRRSALLCASAAALHGALPWIALPALAGVTLAVAWSIAAAPLRELVAPLAAARSQRRVPIAALGDAAIAALVALLVLVAGIALALLGGLLAASMWTLAHLRRGVVRRQYRAIHAGAQAGDAACADSARAEQIRIVEVGQPLLFANIEPVVQAVEAKDAAARVMIVDLTQASAIDTSAARALRDCRATLDADGRILLLVRPAARAARPSVLEGLPVFDHVADAIRHGLETLHAATPVSPVTSGELR